MAPSDKISTIIIVIFTPWNNRFELVKRVTHGYILPGPGPNQERVYAATMMYMFEFLKNHISLYMYVDHSEA